VRFSDVGLRPSKASFTCSALLPPVRNHSTPTRQRAVSADPPWTNPDRTESARAAPETPDRTAAQRAAQVPQRKLQGAAWRQGADLVRKPRLNGGVSYHRSLAPGSRHLRIGCPALLGHLSRGLIAGAAASGLRVGAARCASHAGTARGIALP
jgi:hypothetical protein